MFLRHVIRRAIPVRRKAMVFMREKVFPDISAIYHQNVSYLLIINILVLVIDASIAALSYTFFRLSITLFPLSYTK